MKKFIVIRDKPEIIRFQERLTLLANIAILDIFNILTQRAIL